MTPNDTRERNLRTLARKIDEEPSIGLSGLTKVTPGIHTDERAALLAELVATGRYERRITRGKGAPRQAYWPVQQPTGAAQPSPQQPALSEVATIEAALSRLKMALMRRDELPAEQTAQTVAA